MAHLWVQDDTTGDWNICRLEEPACQFSVDGVLEIPGSEVTEPDSQVVLLAGQRNDGVEQWVLVAGSSSALRLNGEALILGVRVLRDRDELLVNDPVTRIPLATTSPPSYSPMLSHFRQVTNRPVVLGANNQ